MATSESDPSLKLERLFLRLVSISENEKLQTFLHKYLLDIIHTMATGDSGTREKGMEILSHLSRRIKSNSDVKLPVAQLLDCLTSKQKNALTTNFVMVYLKMAMGRIGEEEHRKLLPNVLCAIKANLDDSKVSDQLLVLSARSFIYMAQLTSDKWPSFSALDDASFRARLLAFFQDVVAFKDTTLERLKVEVAGVESRKDEAPACLTRHSFVLIAKELVMELQLSIVMLKAAVVKMISSDLFTAAEKLPLLLLAIANGPDEIEFTASSAVKKIDTDAMLNDSEMCRRLFTLYLGNPEKKPGDEDSFAGASVPLKIRLLPLFIRSQIACTIYPSNIKIAFGGLFGKTNNVAKLMQLSAEFLLLVIKKCPDNSLGMIGPIIFSSLKKLIQNCEFTSVVCVAYQCFGLIGQKVPKLLLGDLQLIQETFDAIPRAPTDVASAIVDCLIVWLPALSNMQDVASAGVLQTIISTYIQHESPKCSLVALKFIEAFVKSPALEFRWTLCCAFGDTREEMKREAKRLLEVSQTDVKTMPKLEDLVEYFYRKLKLEESLSTAATEGNEAKRRKGAIDDEVVTMAARYLFRCACVLSGLAAPVNFERIHESYPNVYKFLCTFDQEMLCVIDMFSKIVFTAVELQPAVDLVESAILLSHCSSTNFNLEFRKKFLTKVRNDTISSARQDICSHLAQLYVCCLNSEEKEAELQAASNTLAEKNEMKPGELWMISYLICSKFSQLTVHMIHNVQTNVFSLIESLLSQPSPLLETACHSLAESFRCSLSNLSVADQIHLCSLQKERFSHVTSVMGKIAASRKDTIDVKSKEAAVKCLGFLSTLYLEESLYNEIVLQLLAVGEGQPTPELQFTVGDSLFDTVFGECSPSRRNVYVETEELYMNKTSYEEKKTKCEGRTLKLLDTMIGDKMRHINRHLRQAAFIWLFTFVKRCTKCRITFIKERLYAIQSAFINGLAENDEFTQDIASQGIGIVFDLGSEEQRKAMVAELIESLMSGRKSIIPVTADTQLFEKGELGVGPSGESLTTYKELCALATDLNQPDLIYKFMQLAGHNATINSRKGAAYGFNVVMQQAQNELEPFLPQIVPKLYRYRYDPDPKVMTAMRNLWQLLTSSKKNVVETYAGLIFADLLSTLISPLWRVRESSCLAVSDLLSGQTDKAFTEDAGKLYEILFRVNDDIKESVRLSAKKALTTLIKFTIRNCSREKGESATHLIGIVLPVLIEKGIRSPLKENRILSLKAVMDLSKEAGTALKPHLQTVIPCLLESLSEVEPAWLNYLAARSDTDELELLDTARASAARSSPMVSTLHDLTPLLVEETVESLCPVLCDLLKNSVGVSTRLGACQFLMDLCVRRRQLFATIKGACDRFSSALLSGLRDRNPAVRKQFSIALSYIIKYCSRRQTDRILTFVQQKLQSGEGDEEMTAFNLLRALADNNSETLSDLAPAVVPYVFLICCTEVGKTDEELKKKSALWEELWSDMVPGTDSAIRLYRKEMFEIVSKIMQESSVWSKKAQAATMLTRIIKSVAKDFSPSEADEMFTFLASMLRGRIWDGKDKILGTVMALLEEAGTTLASHWQSKDTCCEKFSVIWKECQKKDHRYGAEAVVCASVFCEKIKIPEKTLDLICYIQDRASKQKNSDSDDSETEESKAKLASVREDARIRLFSALPRCMLGFGDSKELESCLNVIINVLDSKELYWKEKSGLVAELSCVFSKWQENPKVDVSGLLSSLVLLTEEYWSTQNTFARQCMQAMERIMEKVISANLVLGKKFVESDLTTFKLSDAVKSSWSTATTIGRLIEHFQKLK